MFLTKVRYLIKALTSKKDISRTCTHITF